MRRTRSTENLVEPIIEIEHFLHEKCQRLALRQMAEEVDIKPLKDHVVPTDEEPHSRIVYLPIAANNF